MAGTHLPMWQGQPLCLGNPNQSSQPKEAERNSLGDKRESLGADGRTGDEFDEDVAQGRGEVGARDLLQHGAEGVDVSHLAGWVPRARVQDIPPVKHQQEDVRLAGALRAAFLRGTSVRIERETGSGVGWAGKAGGTQRITHTQGTLMAPPVRSECCQEGKPLRVSVG